MKKLSRSDCPWCKGTGYWTCTSRNERVLASGSKVRLLEVKCRSCKRRYRLKETKPPE